jgi:long-chain acyl-CoA synthetase
VVISHGSLANSVSGLLEYMEGSEADNILALIPPHHIMASIANVCGPLVKGASVTYLQTLNSLELLRILNKARITILPGVPQLFYLIHKRIFEEVRRKGPLTRLLFGIALRACRGVRQATGLNPGRILFAKVNRMLGGHLRLLVSAASYFDPHVIRDFFGLGFTVQQGYALTESGGGGTFTPLFDNCIGSAGRPMPGVQMKLVDVDDSGVGEIAIGGRSLMNGYFNDEKATASVMHEGWLHTGDLARVDAKGNYYITGRKKEMIVLSSGKKVHPEEIELHYSKSPVIKEICVLGIVASSEYASSERLHAIIVPDFEYLHTQRIVNCRDAIREDIEELSAALPAHKRILSYEIRTDPLPRTTTRKLMRYVVAREVSSHDGAPRRSSTYRFVEGDDQLGALESSRRILEVIRKECRFQGDLHLDINLELDLGIDSLQRIELVAQVEQLLGIGLGDDGVSGFMTIRDLLRLVQEKRDARLPIAPRTEGEDRITWKQILSEANSGDAEGKYVLRSSGWMVLAHYLLLRIAYFLSKLLFRLEVQGLENLPRKRPFLICPNHQSYLDGVLMAAVLPYGVFRYVFTLGLTTFFSGGIKGAIARAGRVVPIDPDTNVVRATQVSAMGLRAGQALLVFPEGSMTSDGRLQPFKKGPAILSRELGAPIVPVAIRGSFEAWSKVRDGIRLAPITITFGRPLAAGGFVGLESDRETEYAEITLRLRSAIEELMSEPVLRRS